MLRSIYLLSFFLLQSLFAFAGNVKESVPSTFDLYVCIGQSNMAGRATLTPEVMDTLQNVYLLNDKGNFEPAVKSSQSLFYSSERFVNAASGPGLWLC